MRTAYNGQTMGGIEDRLQPWRLVRWIALVLLALPAGCSRAEQEGSGASSLLEDTDPRMVRLLEADPRDPLDRDARVIRVLVTHDSTNYFVDAGQQRGLEYELMHDFEAFLAERHPSPTPPRMVFLAQTFEDLIPSLRAGRGDIVAAGLTVTSARKEKVAFSAPYRRGVREVVVRHEGADPIDSPDALAGRTVHVVRGSSYADHLRAHSERLVARGLEPVEIVEADRHLRTEDLLQMVHAGIHPYTVADDHIAQLWAEVLDEAVVVTAAVHEGGRLAWAVRPGNETLRRALDAYARERRQGTLLGNVLFRRYYGDVRWVEDPTEPLPKGRLRNVSRAFQRAGSRHGFDWLALAAVGFQESRFDPDAESAAGAVGIMQIRPETAADPNVGVENVEDDVEANIEAGARYLAFLRDRYFSSPEISDAARFDFTLAAYNAGPARIRRLRATARERGLDPNRWFGHVEHVARAELGRETFHYVGNVEKIYAALRSVRHQLEARAEARADGGS